MTNQETVNEAKRAIQNVFEDNSVSLEDAVANLETLLDDLEMYINAVKEDIRRHEAGL